MTSFLQDKQLTIALSGEIDHHSAKRIMSQIGEKIDQFLPRLCILDFKGVTFMDSSGIAIVIHTYRRVTEMRGIVKVKRVPAQAGKVLNAAGVERIVEIERMEPRYEN